MPTMGNTSASSLIRSSLSSANARADYEDKLRALQWDNSAKTDSDYQDYYKYISERIARLQSIGTLATSSKAISMMNTASSATKSYISNSIQRTSNEIMTGNASSADKLAALEGFYYQAVASGDQDLAQNMLSQYLSYDKQVQNEAIANEAYAYTLAQKNAASIQKGYNGTIDEIESYVNDLSSLVRDGAQGILTEEMKILSEKLIGVLKENGVDTSQMEGKAMNNGSLINGALQGLYQLNKDAAIVLERDDPEAAQQYMQNAQDIFYSRDNGSGGNGSIKFMGKDFTLESSAEYASNPDLYYKTTNDNGDIVYKESPGVAYAYNAFGEIVKVVDKTNKRIANADMAGDKGKGNRESSIKELEKVFGLSVIDSSDQDAKAGSFRVSLTGNDSEYGKELRKILKENGIMDEEATFEVRKIGDNYQLVSSERSTKTNNKEIFYISKDSKIFGTGYGISRDKFDIATGTSQLVYLGRTNSSYDRLNNSSSQIAEFFGTNYKTAGAFMKEEILKNTALQENNPNYTNTFITTVANKYYNGNIEAARQDFSTLIRPYEIIRNNKPKNPNVAKIITPPTYNSGILDKSNILLDNSNVNLDAPKVKGVKKTPPPVVKNTAPIVGGPIQFGLGTNNVNAAIANAFKGYKPVYKGGKAYYTEDVIIPTIAKTYYGGDTKKAAKDIYKYRQDTFKEGYGSM